MENNLLEVTTNNCLYHVDSVTSHLLHKIEDVDTSFLPCHVQGIIEGDVATGPAHTGTAVDQARTAVGIFLLLVVGVASHFLPEFEEGGGMIGDAVVRPRGEVELLYWPLFTFLEGRRILKDIILTSAFMTQF